MTLALDLPKELEAELIAYWQRAGLLHKENMKSEAGSQMKYTETKLPIFLLPDALETRLHDLLDRQDAGELLTADERREAEGLVELAEFLSLLHLRALHPPHDA